MRTKRVVLTAVLILLLMAACSTRKPYTPEFISIQITDQADLWWARALADIDGDGDYDIFRYPTLDVNDFYVMINQLQ